MKFTTRVFAILLSVILVLGLLPGLASALVVKDSGYTKIGSLPNDYEATQGMCSDGTYIYTFKHPYGNESLARIYRTTISSGSTTLLKYTDDTSLTNFLALGHGNDMCAVVHNGVTYLYLTTMYHKSHSTLATHSIWKLQVTGSTIKKVAYYDVVSGTTDRNFTGLTLFKQTDTSVTLLAANGYNIHALEIPLDNTNRTITSKKAFSIDYNTAKVSISGAPTFTFKNSSGTSLYEVQGMTYSNGKLYYIMTASSANTPRSKNYILVYDISDYPGNSGTHACIASESIYVTSSTYNYFLEFESIDIKDGVMYFAANAGKSGYYENYDFVGKLNAKFETTPEYTVTFCDEAGSTLQSVKVKEGETAKYTGTTPTKAYDDANHYTFNTWLSSVGGSAATLTNIQTDMKVYAGFIATTHSYTEKINTNPSCSAEGLKTLTCTCGRTYTEAIAKTEHTPMLINAKAATCTAEGYTGDTVCSICNAPISTGTVIEKLAHTPVTDKGYAASCTATGLSDGSHCGTCGEVLVKQEVLPITDHRTEVIVGTPATCLNSGISDGLKCADCGLIVKAQEVLPRLGHSYDYINNGDTHSGVCVRCSKTVNQAHSFVNGSCVCGATLSTEDNVDTSIVIQHSLNLASDISINYAVKSSLLSDYDNFYLSCEIPVFENNVQTGTKTLQIQPELNGNYYYFTLNGLNAVSMNHMVESTLIMSKNGQSFVSNKDIYSIASYAYAQLNKEDVSSELKALCANLLRYGAQTQIYKNYCVNSLPDAAMTAAQRSYLVDLDAVSFETTNRILNDVASPKVTWAGKSLNLESKVALKFVFDAANFNGDPTKLQLWISYKNTKGELVTDCVENPTLYQPGTQKYSFDFDGLLAAELRSVVSAAIYNGIEQVSPTMEYSASAYGNNKTGELLTVCKALMAYSDCAKAYFAG